MKKENYITSDFYAAAFIKASGGFLIGINKADPRRFRFLFEDFKNRAKLVEDFFNGMASVEPQCFVGAIKELKSLMYSDAR